MAGRLQGIWKRMTSPRKMRRREAGLTLTELMVTVVIVGIVSAVAIPSMSKDRKQNEGRKYMQEATKLLQRVRYQAIAERQSYAVRVFSDRLDVCTYPAWAIVKTLRVPPGVTNFDWLPTLPGSQVIGPSTYRFMILTSLGSMVYNTTVLTTVTNASLWTRNTNLPANHPYYQARIDVTALTGFVTSLDRWN